MNQALDLPIKQSPEREGYGEDRHWLATIEMGFEQRAGRTALPILKHLGPLRVQRPFYPEGPVCHVYLLHPPGGLVSGDQLRIEAHLQPGCDALITTPSAGKIYKGDSCSVSQQQQVQLTVAENATLEWLPQETILFDGALGQSTTRIDLKPDGRFIGWEIICLGRPASDIEFNHGCFLQDMAIYRDDLPLLLERQHLQAGSDLATQRWGLNGKGVIGNLYAVGFEQEPVDLIESLREFIDSYCNQFIEQENDLPVPCVSVTWRLGVLAVRYLGEDAEQARNCFSGLWQLLRPALTGRDAEIPRIWLT